MTAEIWTAQLRIVEGEASEESPEIAFAERYDRADRRAGLYILAEPARPGSERFIGEMVTRIGEDFLTTEGSVTGTLQRVLRDRHAELRDWNRRNLPKDQASYGVSCLVLRDDASFLCQLGPSLAYVRQGSTLARHEPREKRAGRPLGFAEVASPEFHRVELGADGYALLISSAVEAVLSEAVRERLQETPPDEVLAFLYPFLITLPSVSALVVAPLPAVARAALEAGPESPDETKAVELAAAQAGADAEAPLLQELEAPEPEAEAPALGPPGAEQPAGLEATEAEPERTTQVPAPEPLRGEPEAAAAASVTGEAGPGSAYVPAETVGYGLGGGGLGGGGLGGGGLGGGGLGGGGLGGAAHSPPPAAETEPALPDEGQASERPARSGSGGAGSGGTGFVGAFRGGLRRMLGRETRDPWEAVEPEAGGAGTARGGAPGPVGGDGAAEDRGPAAHPAGGEAGASAASAVPQSLERIEPASLVAPVFEPPEFQLPESTAEPPPVLEVAERALLRDPSEMSEPTSPAAGEPGQPGRAETTEADGQDEAWPRGGDRLSGGESRDEGGEPADGEGDEPEGSYGLGGGGSSGQDPGQRTGNQAARPAAPGGGRPAEGGAGGDSRAADESERWGGATDEGSETVAPDLPPPLESEGAGGRRRQGETTPRPVRACWTEATRRHPLGRRRSALGLARRSRGRFRYRCHSGHRPCHR